MMIHSSMVDLELIIVFVATPPDWFLPGPNLRVQEFEKDRGTGMKLEDVSHIGVSLKNVEDQIASAESIDRSELGKEEESNESRTLKPPIIPTEEKRNFEESLLSTGSEELNLSLVKAFIFKEIRKPSKGKHVSSIINLIRIPIHCHDRLNPFSFPTTQSIMSFWKRSIQSHRLRFVITSSKKSLMRPRNSKNMA